MNINRIIRVFGLIVMITGGVIGIAEFENAEYRMLALMTCVVGTLLMRTSKIKSLARPHDVSRQNEFAAMQNRPRPIAWVLGIVSVVALVISGTALYLDASYGYHWEWPLYVFVGSVIIAAPALGYLFAKMGWFI